MSSTQVSCQGEKVVTQAVNIADRRQVLLAFRFDLDRASLGPAADGTGNMGHRSRFRFAGQHECGLRREGVGHPVDFSFEEGRLGFVEGFQLLGTAVVGQVGAGVHQLDLDAPQRQVLPTGLTAEKAQPADQFVEVAVSHHAGMRLAHARPADQGSGTGITGLGVDFHRSLFCRRAGG